MDEILALQTELAAAQRSTSVHRLSDRNCIELVTRLQSMQKIDVIFSRNGKEYITRTRLVDEMTDSLRVHNGRINLTDLSDHLNVSLTHVEALSERAMDLYRTRHGDGVKIIRGEFITDAYLSSLVDDENQWLQAHSSASHDTLADFATRVALPADVVRATLTTYASRLQAQFDPRLGTITSYAAIRRKKAAIRGKLSAITNITILEGAATTISGGPGQSKNSGGGHHLSNDNEVEIEIAKDMIENGEINARLEGGKRQKVLVPKIMEDAVTRAMTSRLASDGFVSLDELRRLHFDVDQYREVPAMDDDDDDIDEGNNDMASETKLRSKSNTISNTNGDENKSLSDRVARLSHVLISPVLYDPLATAAAETIHANAWLDIVSALPPSFPHADLPQLLRLVVRQAIASDGDAKESTIAGTEQVVEDDNKGQRKEKSSKTPSSARRRKSTGGPRTRAKARELQAKAESQMMRMPIIASRFIVSPKLLQRIKDAIMADAQHQGTACAKKLAEQQETVGGAEVVETGSGIANSTQGMMSPSAKTTHANDELISSTPSSRKGKGKTKGRRRGSSAVTSTANNDNLHHHQDITMLQRLLNIPDFEHVVELVLGDVDCARAFALDYLGSSGDGGEGEDCIRAYIEQSFPTQVVNDMYISTARDIVEELERKRIAYKLETNRRIVDTLLFAQLTHKCAGTLPSEKLMATSRRYIAREVCGRRVVADVLMLVAENNGVAVDEADKNGEQIRMKNMETLFELISDKVAPAIRMHLQTLVDAVVSQGEGGEQERHEEDGDGQVAMLEIDDFMAVYDQVTPILDLPPRVALDKKSERATMADMRGQLIGKLSALAGGAAATEEATGAQGSDSSGAQRQRRRDLDVAQHFTGRGLLKLCVVAVHAKTHAGAVIDFADRAVDRFVDGLIAENGTAQSVASLAALADTVRTLGVHDAAVIGRAGGAEGDADVDNLDGNGAGFVPSVGAEEAVVQKLAGIVESIGG